MQHNNSLSFMQNLIELIKTLTRPGYMTLATILLAIGIELLIGGFWIRLFNCVFSGATCSTLFDTQLAEDPIQGALGGFFIISATLIVCYFEHLRLTIKQGKTAVQPLISRQYKKLLKNLQKKNLDPQQLAAVAAEPITTPTHLNVHYLNAWLSHPKAISTKFTELTLLLENTDDEIETRFRSSTTYTSLNSLLNAPEHRVHQSFVLLGRPGCGKSTLLKHLQYELSYDALTQQNGSTQPISFLVRLNEYPPEQQPDLDPATWLSQRWSQRYPQLPSLNELQAQQGIVFLLDALNEMRCSDTQDYLAKVKRWKLWLSQLQEQHNHCRVIFTCRHLHYSEPLSTDTIVPQIQFEELSDEKVKDYLTHYLPNQGLALFQSLKKVSGFAEFKTPFYLNLAINYYQHYKDLSQITPAGLIASMIWLALDRELRKTADKLDLSSLSEKDRQRIIQKSWTQAPHQLPIEGFLIPFLIQTAWLMQQGNTGHDSHQVNIAEVTLKQRLTQHNVPLNNIDTMLKLASDLEFIERDLIQETCQFTHQILQEYFAAHAWLATTDFSMIEQPHLVADMKESLANTQQQLIAGEPLPPPSPHGWEQTALYAAAISREKQTFIETLSQSDLVLAAQCAAQQLTYLSPTLINHLQEQLIERMQDDQSDLRARIAAGLALGQLGDPRFAKKICDKTHKHYIEPSWSHIHAGTVLLGSETGRDNERPVHALHVDAFDIGQYLVTNAEWQCFMDDGGYENPLWWEKTSDTAVRWQQGELEDTISIEWYKKRYQEFTADFEATKTKYNYSKYRLIEWENLLKIPYEEFITSLKTHYRAQKYRYPRHWFDPRFNNPSQPVIGICWFEALAYCHWLSDKLGKTITLPSEEQWQAAGYCQLDNNKFRYPWGEDFIPLLSNTDNLYIRTTTPVGLFKRGAAPKVMNRRDDVIYDMVGNCWEWTKSIYQAYPICDKDKHNDITQSHGYKIKMGGSWASDPSRSTLTIRNNEVSLFRFDNIGFRVVCENYKTR